MKQLYSVTFILVFSLNFTLAFSQNQSVNYAYDANGNRVKQWITTMKIDHNDTIDSIHQDSIIKNQTSDSCSTIKKSISLFPNPTQGLLELKIIGMKEGETAEYVFFSISGQEIFRRETASSLTEIDISNFAPGTYFLSVIFEKRTEGWKVVKQ
jgi:hypothetical protein